MTKQFEKLRQIRCFLMDMDGTIYLGEKLLPGARDWLELLDEHGIAYYFLTNNSSRSRVEYAEKFTRLGLSVPEEKIFTSGEATAIYLAKYYPDAALYVVGTPALMAEFERHGFVLTETDPDVAVLGFDTTLTYDKLWKLCDLVVAGKPYIATHPDINCPTEDGFKPDIGSMIELVATSTGRRPDVIIGKPYQPVVDALSHKTGFPVEAHCMVGDRLYTDIALGRWGITTALVLSGETKAADQAGPEYTPDFVVANIAEMANLLRKARG
ncbi:MAG: HAD-IIA family hydrolase [Desulfosarcina sp.]|nr:HAD-IIA family hydrolase [Desulfosarcina sp.]